MNTATFKTRPADMGHPVPDARFRTGRADVSGLDVTAETEGGRFDAGILRRVSLISSGEALGHGMWIDDVALEQVAYLAEQTSDAGVKSRFTHPSMSSDGTGKHLGRIHDVEHSGDRVVGDLHFAKSAHKTPDGDLAEYVMELAAEDPRAAGLSIAFDRDFQMEIDFLLAHGAHVSEDGESLDLSEFKSPDEANTQNFPHVRVSELRAADVVDEPAANPGGLFDRQPEARAVDDLLSFAVGLSETKPQTVFGVDPDRAAQFFKRWMASHGVEFNTTKPEDPTMGKTTETTPAPTREDFAKELGRYVDKFGTEKGSKWFAAGRDYVECCEARIDELTEANTKLSGSVKDLEHKLANVSMGEADPVEGGDGSARKDLEKDVIRMPHPSAN